MVSEVQLLVRLPARAVNYPRPQATFRNYSYSFDTCPNSSSTGVERPKIDTATRRRLFS